MPHLTCYPDTNDILDRLRGLGLYAPTGAYLDIMRELATLPATARTRQSETARLWLLGFTVGRCADWQQYARTQHLLAVLPSLPSDTAAAARSRQWQSAHQLGYHTRQQ